MNRKIVRLLFALAIVALIVIAPYASEAIAANNAYAVDAADISEVGSCKLESWISTATNADFSAVANPSCVVHILRPVEIDLPVNRARSDGDLSTTLSPKVKINLLPTGIGRFGVGAYTSGSFDTLSGANTAVFAVIPATYRFSETLRLNLNGGWYWDRVADRHYLSYGAGFDWKFTDLLQLTVETFGLAGSADRSSIIQPRFQAGIRYRPNEIFSIDLIAGRNITGENASWITLGTTVRFPDLFKWRGQCGPRCDD